MKQGRKLSRNMVCQNRLMAGFHLIENLITLVVLSVGLLGFIGLQATALRISHHASMQSKAVDLATNITSRMRANPEGVSLGGYTDTPTKTPSCYLSCSANLMAKNDLWEWMRRIRDSLPGVGGICQGKISASSGSNALAAMTDGCSNDGDIYTIWLIWDSNHDGNLDNPFVFNIDGDSNHIIIFEP